MRTRMVRGRRRGGGLRWAAVLLCGAMAVYVRVSLPLLAELGKTENTSLQEIRCTRSVELTAVDVQLICFGKWTEQSTAQIEAGRYVPRGAAGYVLQDGREFLVIGAMYENAVQADRVCTLLRESEGLDCTVRREYAAGLTLRMTAPEGQIEAFERGEAVLREAWRALGPLALALDRKEADRAQALAVVHTHRKRLEDARENLQKAGASGEALFAGLHDLMGTLIIQLEEVEDKNGVMSISAGLKYCSIDAALRQAEWMRAMGR